MCHRAPHSATTGTPEQRERWRSIVERRQLGELANDTKWDEFLNAMRELPEWRPKFRFRCIDESKGESCEWDREWYYHLPFPLMSLEWIDLFTQEEVIEHRLPRRITIVDHTNELTAFLDRIGLDYRVGEQMIRVFGYSPRSLEYFDVLQPL